MCICIKLLFQDFYIKQCYFIFKQYSFRETFHVVSNKNKSEQVLKRSCAITVTDIITARVLVRGATLSAMALSKSLNDEQISALLFVSDTDENEDDISDQEFIPQADDSSSECCDIDDVLTEDISAAASSTAADATHLQSSFDDHWYLNEPASQGRKKSLNILTSKSGVTAYATNQIAEDPCTAFDLIFDKNMMKTILVETNKQGKRISEDWKLIRENKLRAYVGPCILRGVYRSRNQAVRQLWSPEFGSPIFSKTMSVKRFEEIR